MTIDTKNLRVLAEAATPGPWMRLFGERTVYVRMEDGCRGIPIVRSDCSPPTQKEAANIDYIAACSPDVVLALLDALERKDRVLREALEAIEIAKNGLDWFKDSYPHDVNESDAEASEQINEAIEAITKELAP